MAFTIEEEAILKLMINELRTRSKLNSKREEKDIETRDAYGTLTEGINNDYKTELDSLQENYNVAESKLKVVFE